MPLDLLQSAQQRHLPLHVPLCLRVLHRLRRLAEPDALGLRRGAVGVGRLGKGREACGSIWGGRPLQDRGLLGATAALDAKVTCRRAQLCLDLMGPRMGVAAPAPCSSTAAHPVPGAAVRLIGLAIGALVAALHARHPGRLVALPDPEERALEEAPRAWTGAHAARARQSRALLQGVQAAGVGTGHGVLTAAALRSVVIAVVGRVMACVDVQYQCRWLVGWSSGWWRIAVGCCRRQPRCRVGHVVALGTVVSCITCMWLWERGVRRVRVGVVEVWGRLGVVWRAVASRCRGIIFGRGVWRPRALRGPVRVHS
jgi:hypothetical protein